MNHAGWISITIECIIQISAIHTPYPFAHYGGLLYELSHSTLQTQVGTCHETVKGVCGDIIV